MILNKLVTVFLKSPEEEQAEQEKSKKKSKDKKGDKTKKSKYIGY